MNQKRCFWMIATVIGVLLGLGIGQMVQSQEATAEPQEGFAQLKAELNALKAKQRALQAEWQAELLAQVVPTLADESEKVKRQFVDFLEDLGKPGTAALIAMLEDPSAQIRQKAADRLGAIGERLAKNGEPTDTIRDALIAGLADESSSVRTNAIEELSDIRSTSSETFAALTNALTDKSKSVRNRAEDELIQLGKGAATTVIPILADGLGNSTSPITRGHIVDVLGAIGEKGKTTEDDHERIVQSLLVALQDTDENVRRNAADELGEMRAASLDVLTALTNAREDNSQKVRNAAQKAIRRIEKK